jgi:hypothetical protein
MGGDFVSMFQLETKRLLWLIGITFAIILSFQYLELPYGNVLLSLFSSNKLPMSQTIDTNNTIVNNVTIFNQQNSTDEFAIEKVNATKDTVSITGFVLEPGFDESNKSSMVDDSVKSLGNVSNVQKVEENVVSTNLTQAFGSTTNASPNITNAVLSNGDNKSSLSQKPISPVPKENHETHSTIPQVTTVSEMKKLLLQSHVSYRSMVCDKSLTVH